MRARSSAFSANAALHWVSSSDRAEAVVQSLQWGKALLDLSMSLLTSFSMGTLAICPLGSAGLKTGKVGEGVDRLVSSREGFFKKPRIECVLAGPAEKERAREGSLNSDITTNHSLPTPVRAELLRPILGSIMWRFDSIWDSRLVGFRCATSVIVASSNNLVDLLDLCIIFLLQLCILLTCWCGTRRNGRSP